MSPSDDSRRLLDHLAPNPKDGRVLGFLTTTYELQPEFFDTDLLPTLLGLRSLNDRSWNARVKMEVELARMDAAAVVMTANRYHGRPRSLRVDLHPLTPREAGIQHAKVTLVEQEHAVRLHVTSANLTEAGYRRNREVVAALHVSNKDPSHAPLVLSALTAMPPRLLERLTANPRTAQWLDRTRARVEAWSGATKADPTMQFLWGGSDRPLWQQFVEQWPSTDKVELIQVVSPYWSDEDGNGPLTRWVRELRARDLLADNARLRLLSAPSFDGVHGWHPTLPASFHSYDFSALGIEATTVAVDPQVDPRDVDIKDFMGRRELHAKLLVFSGKKHDLVYLGSANMSHQGWGFLGAPNIEAGLAVTFTKQRRAALTQLLPPTTGDEVPLDGDVASRALAVPEPDTDPTLWPNFLRTVELVPSSEGDELELRVELLAGLVEGPWSLSVGDGAPFVDDDHGGPETRVISIDGSTLRQLVREQQVQVRWWSLADQASPALFPLNVVGDGRELLPIAPNQLLPGENALIAYYQARVTYADLFPPPPGEDNADDDGSTEQDEASEVDTSTIQSYQIREFVEALPGILDDLRGATCSDSAMRLALAGPVSPIALAKLILDQVECSRRSPVAASFQLLELRGRLAAARKFEVDEQHREAWHSHLDTADCRLGTMLETLRDQYPTQIAANPQLATFQARLQTLFAGDPS